MTTVLGRSAPEAAGELATPRGRRGSPTAAPLAGAVAGAAVLSLLVGARSVPLSALWDSTDPLRAVVEARLDRTVLGLAVGAALGLAGAVMQGLTRNPLADPGILGVNAGATFAMVVGMSVLGLSSTTLLLPLAFLGAAVAAVVVHLLASVGRGGATPMRLAITGAALTAGLMSWTSGLLLIDAQTMERFRYWQVGSVAGRGLDLLITALPFIALGAVLALVGARTLDTLALGDDLARGLGRRTALDRAVLSLAVVLLAGSATAIAGPIAFVGLVVPHVVRAFVGPHHARLLPLSMLAGALLVVVADTVGRVVLPPAEVQVGIMAAVVGVPFFLALVRRTGRAL
jgi:iron complex transport system permease protein